MNIGNAPLGVTDGATGIVGGIGIPVTETASIAYDGTLLPTGTASYAGISIDATKRYLKNSGKDKTPALVESGQGKFFNGTSQYINTGITPNQAQGTLVTRFTYASGQVSLCIIGTVSLSIWVNASGKIEGQFGDVLVASTDVLTNGLSYHVSLSWVGLVATLKVNYVTKASGTATAFNPANVMYIGARNNVGTADRYFNNVIDETYYYDVTLPDTAIQSLYRYPEKIKSYNGAIVPDIGYEANCKLFLPMSESGIGASGSNVVNVAVGRGSETTDGTYESLVLSDGVEVQTAITGGVNLKVTTIGTTTVMSSRARCSFGDGGAYMLQCNYKVNSGTPKLNKIYNGTATIGLDITFTGSGTFNLVVPTFTYDSLRMYWYNTALFDINITFSSVKKISAFPITNFSDAMNTSAKQLPYGAQCTAWKRDSLGVLLGMSNGLRFDGGVSAKGASTGWTPNPTQPFVVEAVIKRLEAVASQLFGCADSSTGRLSLGVSSVLNAQSNIGDKFPVTTVATNYIHMVTVYNGTIGQSKIFINGVENTAYAKETSFTTPTTPFYVGSLGTVQKALDIYSSKIHKGTQYSKFDIAKAWAKAQKTIAKLGA